MISELKKKKPGPPPTGKGMPVLVRLQPIDMDLIDEWIAEQPDPKPTRPEAIRLALKEHFNSPEFKRAKARAIKTGKPQQVG